ncbi:MAG: sigma-70 family RNA polymerase sigma factor [candidate division Zixibacteria bacterium]|nr:sigma-70 family RNA polymerase sigma factor [candidate division Zixibacteria bacterium]
MFLLVLMLAGMDDTPDGELIRRAKQGDRAAFGLLVRRYQRKVYALCFRLGGSHDVADDLTQEAFIKAFQAVGTFDEKYPFGGWIARIAANNAFNYLNRQKFQLSGEESELALDQMAAVDSDPQEMLTQQEIDKRYQHALAQLPPDYRIVFVLRMQEEMSYADIATTLKINEGTVMSRLHRARRKLMLALKDLLEP